MLIYYANLYFILKGAEAIYKVFVRPIIKRHEKDIDVQIDVLKKKGEQYHLKQTNKTNETETNNRYQRKAEKLAKQKSSEASAYIQAKVVKSVVGGGQNQGN